MSTLSAVSPQKRSRLDFPPSSHSGPPTLKLKAAEVFKQLRSSMGMLVQSSQVVKSGCFITMNKKAYFITSSPQENPLPNDELKVVHESGMYELKTPENSPEESQVERIHSLGLKLFECHGRLTPGLTFFEFAPEEIYPFEAGTKVYFGGAPLGTNQLTFHRGTISLEERSPSKEAPSGDPIHHFSIDGTAVQGFSGGPAAMQHNGKVYLIGLLQSQVTSNSLQEAKSLIENGIQTDDSNVYALQHRIQKTFKSLFDNLSTGIVSAIDIKHSYELIDWEKEAPLLSRDVQQILGRVLYGEVPIGIKPRTIREMLKEQGYTKTEGRSHELWTKEGKTSIPVSRSSKHDIPMGTVSGIIKTIALNEHSDETSGGYEKLLNELKEYLGLK